MYRCHACPAPLRRLQSSKWYAAPVNDTVCQETAGRYSPMNSHSGHSPMTPPQGYLCDVQTLPQGYLCGVQTIMSQGTFEGCRQCPRVPLRGADNVPGYLWGVQTDTTYIRVTCEGCRHCPRATCVACRQCPRVPVRGADRHYIYQGDLWGVQTLPQGYLCGVQTMSQGTCVACRQCPRVPVCEVQTLHILGWLVRRADIVTGLPVWGAETAPGRPVRGVFVYFHWSPREPCTTNRWSQ